MLKVLENSNRTDIFVALLALSRTQPPELQSSPASALKFFDLAVKCLIKLTKALTTTLKVRANILRDPTSSSLRLRAEQLH